MHQPFSPVPAPLSWELLVKVRRAGHQRHPQSTENWGMGWRCSGHCRPLHRYPGLKPSDMAGAPAVCRCWERVVGHSELALNGDLGSVHRLRAD